METHHDFADGVYNRSTTSSTMWFSQRSIQISNQFHQKKYPIYRQNYLSAAAAAFCLPSCCWINIVPCNRITS
ncbi:uncharacterized protein LAJ45_05028 [Morchella importuna]|uniref:uncharacterized protein n=1 Tax=Morchella importuna TaxID=1174673 RepID=UPI001E8EE0A9|nr:uncharacterized protein LAJ45_05028 [Morchella importuna]KAH8150847.1 hypothetical protein LAJ45_05028 [Morchella importuna]